MVTTCQVSYGKGHPQYRSLMAALTGAPAEENEGLGPEPLTYRLVRALCPSAHPGQAICSPYIPSVCPGPVTERFGPFPGLTEFQDTISSNGMRIWLSSQQIRAARPPTCVCPPDPQTGSQPMCCQPEGKQGVAC
ncbi:uncharacterized protein LOC124585510 [Schistocerca americana]|uniref:uncharacterized protein LOC124585510 n=1 Tax=Schistocerca americana TaxID=7009 RepID=UPI001F4F3B26|nr:uncharacterized protein LOC124585510 [Schistocerca americana]